MTWVTDDGAQDMIPPPVHLLLSVPLEVRKTTLLRDFHVSIYGSWYWNKDFVPALSAQNMLDLEALANDLESFAYRGGCPEDLSLVPEFAKYLRILVTGKQLQSLNLDLDSPNFEEQDDDHHVFHHTDVSPVLSVGLSSKLKCLELVSCSFTSEAFEPFFARCEPKSIAARLFGVLLLSGSWSRVLDLLREKADGDSTLENASGQECEFLDYDQHDAIFPDGWDDDVPGGAGSATAYIAGHPGDGQSNPFLLDSL